MEVNLHVHYKVTNKILFLEAILCYGTVLNLVNLVRNEVLARYFNIFFIIWSFFFSSTQVTCYAFYFSSFFKGEKGDCHLSQGF